MLGCDSITGLTSYDILVVCATAINAISYKYEMTVIVKCNTCRF